MTASVPPHIMAADNLLTTAGFMLSMLTEPRSAAERVSLYEMARDCIKSAADFLREAAAL